MQSRRVWLPDVVDPLDLTVVTASGSGAPLGLPVAWALAVPGGPPLHPACSAVLVGPEGGWTPSELEIAAPRVVANVNPKLLYLQLIDAAALDGDFRQRIEAYRCASATFRINVALDAVPDFACLPGDGAHLRSGIIIAPSLAYMERAYFDARQHGWSREPIVELLIPSLVDHTLAPPGKHVASLFCQHANPVLPDGVSWDAARDEVADLMIATVNRHAPNFAASVIGRRILSPLDLEREFGLIGGDIFHGALSLDQLFSARPVLGHGHYRGPLKGLYMCGAGTHPGGGVTGVPGHNAAREIMRDLRRRKHV
jgi:phytoene dehydrogenase-like protein